MALPVSNRYSSNPFIKDLLKQSKKGEPLKQYSADGSKFMIVNTNTLETAPVSAFGTSEEVEMNRFVKLYVDGVGAIMGLKNAGKKVFGLLYMQIRGKDGKDKDEVTLNYALIPEETKKELKLSNTTFYRGVRELIDLKFIAPTMAINVYYINPTYIFNGDRLVIMNQYLLKEREKEKAYDRKRKEERYKNITTVNIPGVALSKTEEGNLFEELHDQMKTQLADGKRFDPETGEILE